MMCTFIEYRVEVHYKTHTYDINSVTHRKEPCKHEVIDYEYFVILTEKRLLMLQQILRQIYTSQILLK